MLSRLDRIQLHKMENYNYNISYWHDYNYKILQLIRYVKRAGRGSNESFSNAWIMADFETSKSLDKKDNYIVSWSISIRAYGRNIVSLVGRKPSEFIKCLDLIRHYLSGDKILIYWHNMSYDWIFSRKFMFNAFGFPIHQLSTKPHFPIMFEFENGIVFKDSLILFQRSLEKTAKDFNVEHQKAVGSWDYEKHRNQDTPLTDEEWTYQVNDTLAGVESLDALCESLNKHIYSMPYTATGIPRNECRERGYKSAAHNTFKSMALSFQQYKRFERVFAGGVTHGNRHFTGEVVEDVEGFDFASSYPFQMVSNFFPMESFTEYAEFCAPEDILDQCKEYAFIFTFKAYNVRLKDWATPMPYISMAKCDNCISPVLDNGRIIKATYIEIELLDPDLEIIMDMYDFDEVVCQNVESAMKRYLPRWFTDYCFELFEAKTKLKKSDPINYQIAKGKLNSLYGMTVQKCIREALEEDWQTGEYIAPELDEMSEYNKYLNKRGTIFPYQWGCYVTAYARKALYKLGACIDYENGGEWIYSDTDSCYAYGWNYEKIEEYNNSCIEALKANGYEGVMFDGRMYYLGVAEHHPTKDTYTEFVQVGAKRYCGRCVDDGELHITVSGVPKSGVKQLENNIHNFKKGLIFSGDVTGKLTHEYIYSDDIYIDEFGNEIGDSINLTPCDYLLDDCYKNWDSLFYKEIGVHYYD